MSVFKRYVNFMLRTMLVAILTAVSSLLITFIGTQMMIPLWFNPVVTVVTLIIGSLFMFRRQEKQITSKLLDELEDFSKTFHSLTMGGGENREMQIRFMLDRVNISDRSQKENLQMRGNHIKDCHNLIEKWFKCHRDEVEYFLKHPKSIDVDNTIRLINEFKQIVFDYKIKFIDATIDYMNDIKAFPKDLKERFETNFDALKSKYNYFGNQFNDYIKHLNKELSWHMDGIEIISKDLKLENEEI
ncbi:MAG: hypothetical protein H3Z51_05635, partial [archaeon]|nr:hypothetical protein [archaeon]